MVKKGGTVCAVRWCKNRTIHKDVTLFRFPKNRERSELWLTACNREDLRDKSTVQLYNNFKVCAEHFEDRMFKSTERNRLLPTAIPTVFLQLESYS